MKLSMEQLHAKLEKNQINLHKSVAYHIYVHAIKRQLKKITKNRNEISDSTGWIQTSDNITI
jgi:hypothetical protein